MSRATRRHPTPTRGIGAYSTEHRCRGIPEFSLARVLLLGSRSDFDLRVANLEWHRFQFSSQPTTKPATMASTREILRFLQTIECEGGIIDRLKVYYRPITAPFRELLSYSWPGARVGDLGCGNGQFALLLARFCRPSYIFGCEISPRLVANARTLLSRHSDVPATIVEYDGVHLPSALGELDIVFVNDVLHHVPRDRQPGWLAAVCQAIRPGARLILKDVDGGGALVAFNKLHDLVFAGEIGAEWPIGEAERFTRSLGMTQHSRQELRRFCYQHYVLELSRADGAPRVAP